MKPRPQPPSNTPAPHHFELTVWPQTPAQPWRAVVCGQGVPPPQDLLPQRFDAPVQLLLFLTQLPGAKPSGSGLR